MNKIKFAVDRGGTFTDVYAQVGDSTYIEKLLSEDPDNYTDAPREGIRRLLEKINNRPYEKNNFPAEEIDWIRMGTTVATNALLERKGTRCALVVTKGFKDILKIGNQTRDNIFDLVIKKLVPIYETVVEVEERIWPLKGSDSIEQNKIVTGLSGEQFIVLQKPNKEKIYSELKRVYNSGIRSIAVALMHAYSYFEHELVIKQIAANLGFEQISLSHQVMPMVKITARGDTTTVDAYLTPHIHQYLQSFKHGFSCGLKNTNLLFMQSDGGLTKADNFKGSNAIISGPAGGVVGYARTAFDYLNAPIIGFDMGGTSTDVSRFDGEYELNHESETAGVKIQAPQININTVAAGGGSRLFFKNGMFEVGPESAGAHPGPICYKKGGYLAVTDANLLLGRLQIDYFPKIFGKSGCEALSFEDSRKAFSKLASEISTSYKSITIEEIAMGFIKVANEVMIRPIREISVMRGYDVKEHALACFGGAGGQHACAIAKELGIKTIFIHRVSGILSAYGIALADIVSDLREPASLEYNNSNYGQIKKRLIKLEEKAISKLISQSYPSNHITSQRYLNLRYEGTDTKIMIPEPNDENYEKAFKKEHFREFGFNLVDRKILVDDIRAREIAKSPTVNVAKIKKRSSNLRPDSIVDCYFEGGYKKTPIYLSADLCSGDIMPAPAIIMQDTSTILIEPACRAEVTEYGDIIINVDSVTKKSLPTDLDPIQLSIFSNLFMSVAEQMGRTLQRTSVSTNIKERLDFSCAIFDKSGNLVANAPHIPVHLGAMGEAVKSIIKLTKNNINEGDVFVTNHPKYGGSHLPDITVITPIWDKGKIIFFAANRGHHAEIGGVSPGSMPPFSKYLYEEGACIKCLKLVENGIFRENEIRKIRIIFKIYGKCFRCYSL